MNPAQPAALADDGRFERHVDAAAAVLGLPLDAAHRPGTVRYFGLAAQMAALVMAHPLSARDDPAEVFVPIQRPAEPPA